MPRACYAASSETINFDYNNRVPISTGPWFLRDGMATPAELVASALQRWRNNLIDLTRRNPLLSLKANRTSYLESVQPDLLKVYEHLHLNGKNWNFFMPPAADKPTKKQT